MKIEIEIPDEMWVKCPEANRDKATEAIQSIAISLFEAGAIVASTSAALNEMRENLNRGMRRKLDQKRPVDIRKHRRT